MGSSSLHSILDMLIDFRQRHTFQADLRYSGQANNVPVDVDIDALRAHGLSCLREIFDTEHIKLFTYSLSQDVEIVNLRVIAEEAKIGLPVKQLEHAGSNDPRDSVVVSRNTLVFDGKEHQACPIWNRSGLLAGHVLYGPCVISEMDSNTLVHPSYKAEIDATGNILIWEAGGDQAAKAKKEAKQLDTVTVDIFENALRNARNEMDALMTRTTMSPAIREQQDEFNVIAEPGGKMVAGQFGSFIGEFLQIWTGTIEPGDIFLTNDPYSVSGAVSHHNDWLILTPIFADQKMSTYCTYPFIYGRLFKH